MSGTGWSQDIQVAGQIETPRPPDPILRRPCADREEKRVTHGRDIRTNGQLAADRPGQKGSRKGMACAIPTATRYVTENVVMPRGCKPQGDQALSNAERQARYRARH